MYTNSRYKLGKIDRVEVEVELANGKVFDPAKRMIEPIHPMRLRNLVATTWIAKGDLEKIAREAERALMRNYKSPSPEEEIAKIRFVFKRWNPSEYRSDRAPAERKILYELNRINDLTNKH